MNLAEPDVLRFSGGLPPHATLSVPYAHVLQPFKPRLSNRNEPSSRALPIP
jgi:hypothetical protein